MRVLRRPAYWYINLYKDGQLGKPHRTRKLADLNARYRKKTGLKRVGIWRIYPKKDAKL